MEGKQGKQYTIAIMTEDIQSDYSEEMMKGFFTASYEEQVNIVLLIGPQIPSYCADIVAGSSTDNSRYQFDSIYEYMQLIKPDAAIIMYGAFTGYTQIDDKQGFLHQFSNIPCLMIQDQSSDKNIPYVISDNYGGMRECVKHLIEDHGYRNIVFMSGPKNTYDAEVRLCAYHDCMAEHGLDVKESMIAYGDFLGHTEEMVQKLIERNPGVEAVVCANDEMAKGCYRVCTAMNLIVGKDIAITGFDDTYSASTMNPPLTSVSQNNFHISYTAMKTAISMCKGIKARSVCMPTILKRRCSCGCRPSEILQVRYIEEKELETFLRDAIEKIASHMLSKVAYEKHYAHLTEQLYVYFFYIYNTLFVGQEEFSMDRLFDILKQIVTYPHLANDLVLDDLTQLLRVLLANARSAKAQDVISTIISSTQQFLNSLKIEKLEQEVFETNRKSWFVPNFTRDLAEALYMHKPEEMFFRIMTELQKMAVKRAYFFLFEKTVIHAPEQPLDFSKGVGLVAYFDEDEMKFFRNAEKPVFTTEDGLMSFVIEKKPASYIPVVLFSEQRHYGLMMCEVEYADIAFLQMCSVQLGTLFRFIELSMLEQQAQEELQNSLQVIKEQNKILSFISEYDELSKLLNRRGFIEKALSLYEKSEGKRAYLIFGDLDHLKEINDAFGHGEGDFAIRAVADRFRTILPEDAIIGRTGGDEFVAFFLSEKKNYRKYIEAAFAKQSASFNHCSGKPYYVEVSVGIHEFVCSADKDFDEMVDKSDKLLYKAKEERRASIKKPDRL